MHASYSPQSIKKTCACIFFLLRAPCTGPLFPAVSTAIVVRVCACAGNTALPGIQGFLWCLLSSYIDIHCLPPEVLMGLIPGGLILPRYWDSSQCWYCEGWSRVSPVAAGLMEEWQTAGLVSEELK